MREDFKQKGIPMGLKKLFIPIGIIAGVIVFFLSYNTYLVDHSLEDMKFALDQTAKARGVADMEKISLVLDDVLINEVSAPKMNSLSVTKLEFAKNVVAKGGAKAQIGDVEFLLDRLIKVKEKKRGGLLLAFDRMNEDLQKFTRFVTKELPAGILKPELFKPTAKTDLTILKAAEKLEEDWKLPEAISAYDEFMARYPMYPKLLLVRLQVAGAYFKSGDYREARRLYEKIAREKPQSDEAKAAGILLTKVKERLKKQSEKKKLDDDISRIVKASADEKDYKELGLVDAYLRKLDQDTRDLILYVMEGVESVRDGAKRIDLKKVENTRDLIMYVMREIEPMQTAAKKADLRVVDDAKKLEKNWKLKEAQELYEKFINEYAEYKNLVSIKFILAGVYLKSMQYEKALKYYEDVVSNYPDSREAGLSKGLILKTKEIISVHEKRQVLLDKILKIKGAAELARAYYNLGMVNIYIFDVGGAEEAFKRTIELAPGTELEKRSEFMLGWVYKFGAKYEKGISEFSNFIEKYPNDPLMIDSAYHIADSYYKSDKFEEAAKTYEDFADKFTASPLSELTLTQAGYTYLYNLHDPMRASEAFKKLKARYPNADTTEYVYRALVPTVERSYRDYGFILLKEGKFKEAKEAFEKAITIDNKDAWAQCGLGTSCGLLILYDEGIEYASKGVKTIKDEYTYAALAFAYEEKGEYLKAIEQYKFSLLKDPDYVAAHYNLGRAYMLMGWYDEAIGEFKETLRILPDFAEAHNNLGSAYWYKGQVVEAEFEFKAAISSGPDMAEAHYNLGILYDVQGKYTKAANHYRRALELIPELKAAKKRLERVEAKLKK